MLELENQQISIGIINNRIEKDGDQDMTAFDIPFETLLHKDQLNALIGDYAWNALFNSSGEVTAPMFPDFSSFALKHVLTGVAVISIGGGSKDYVIEFKKKGCIKNIRLSPLQGGETQMEGLLQVRPERAHRNHLLDAQNTSIKMSLSEVSRLEKNKAKQGELALAAPDDDDESEDADRPANGFGTHEHAESGSTPPPRTRGKRGGRNGARAHR